MYIKEIGYFRYFQSDKKIRRQTANGLVCSSPDQAIKLGVQWVEVQPNSPYALCNLAVAYRQQRAVADEEAKHNDILQFVQIFDS